MKLEILSEINDIREVRRLIDFRICKLHIYKSGIFILTSYPTI